MSVPRSAIALLLPGSLQHRRGGAGMRWRALHRALSTERECHVIELRCDRYSVCSATCRASLSDAAVHRSPIEYSSSNYCDVEAGEVIRRISALGVSEVICSGLQTHRYVSLLSRADGPLTVFDMHNVEYPLHRSMRAASGDADEFSDEILAATRAAESGAIRAADHVWTCTRTDAGLLRDTYPEHAGKPVFVVPNVVSAAGTPPSATRPARVCFTGLLGWYPNVVAAERLIDEIAPELERRRFNLPIVVAGGAPSPELRDRARRSAVRLIADPRSIGELIAGSIMAVPLTLGGGSRLKILEAMALGAPVVSTAKGAEGLSVEPGRHYLAAETAAEFADAIVRLTQDEPCRRAIVEAGWKLVQESYSITTLSRCLSTILGARRP